jgi:hypothetical protein
MASRPERPRCGRQVGEVCAARSPVGVLNHQLFLARWADLASWTSPSWVRRCRGCAAATGGSGSGRSRPPEPGPGRRPPGRCRRRRRRCRSCLGVDDGWVAGADGAAQPGPGRLGHVLWPAQWVTETSTRSRGHAAPCRWVAWQLGEAALGGVGVGRAAVGEDHGDIVGIVGVDRNVAGGVPADLVPSDCLPRDDCERHVAQPVLELHGRHGLAEALAAVGRLGDHDRGSPSRPPRRPGSGC